MPTTSPADAPLREFRGAHGTIIQGLESLQELPVLAAAMERARTTAAATLALFDEVVREHHSEEEQELFVAVQRSCRDEAEKRQVEDQVALLTSQHRQIESLWDTVRPAVARVAAGKGSGDFMFGAEIDRLVSLYRAHAAQEEEVFLPLADLILRRNANHMEALGISLHLRHAPPPRAYI